MERLKALVIINKDTPYIINNNITEKDIHAQFEVHDIESDVYFFLIDDLVQILDSALAKKQYQILVVGGGDGTLNAVVNKIMGKNIPLAILPLGTFNHFAKDIGLPMSLGECIELCKIGKIEKVDVGKVNDVYFLNNSSVGLYPRMVKTRDQQIRWYRSSKWGAVFWATLNIFRRFPLLRIKLMTVEKSVELTTPLVFVGNNEYEFSLFSLKSRTNIDKGILCFYVVNNRSRWQFLKLLFALLVRELEKSEYFLKLISKSAVLDSTKQELPVAVDGEIIYLQTPLHYQIEPQSLSVIKPRT